MMKFWLKPNEKIFGLKDLGREALIYRVLPHFLMEILRKYFRVEIQGIENLPAKGSALVVPNHSGFSGFDAIILAHIIATEKKRIPRIMAHFLWFWSKTTAIPAHKLGFTEATYENGVKALQKNNIVVLFPEGEHGNFKPSSKAYRLQEFKRGFVRMALETQSPIIPTIIIGAEETHINISQLKFTKFLRGLVIPVPLNFIPLPAKWKIIFLPAIDLPYKKNAVQDDELVHDICADIQDKMQNELVKELKKRDSVYF